LPQKPRKSGAIVHNRPIKNIFSVVRGLQLQQLAQMRFLTPSLNPKSHVLGLAKSCGM